MIPKVVLSVVVCSSESESGDPPPLSCPWGTPTPAPLGTLERSGLQCNNIHKENLKLRLSCEASSQASTGPPLQRELDLRFLQ